MAATRKTAKQETASEPEDTGAKAEEQVALQAQEPPPETEQKSAEESGSVEMIKVNNPTNGFFVQPSTGLRIAAKDTKELRNDGWVELQLKAGTLKKA